MKRNLSTTVSALPIALFFLFNSCGKEFPQEGFFNPLIGGCQVAEYHDSQYDVFFTTKPPYLFRKTFDPSGKIATEMACGFSNDIVPEPRLQLDVLIAQKDRRVFLIRADSGKTIVPDTLVTIYLNREGRPDSCIGRPGSDPETGTTTGYEWEYYFYKDGKIQTVKHTIFFGGEEPGVFFSGSDSVRYDKYGNPVSFGFNTYAYDYTRRGGQKFYLDAFMNDETDFYLLQYLGFFPEINNPPNLQTYSYNSDGAQGGPLGVQQFDAEGKLTGFGPISITWNCSR
jgi:hypothetical protein